MITQSLALLNVPMLKYNTENDDYALMNYVVGGLCVFMMGLTLSAYRKYRRNITKLLLLTENITQF